MSGLIYWAYLTKQKEKSLVEVSNVPRNDCSSPILYNKFYWIKLHPHLPTPKVNPSFLPPDLSSNCPSFVTPESKQDLKDTRHPSFYSGHSLLLLLWSKSLNFHLTFLNRRWPCTVGLSGAIDYVHCLALCCRYEGFVERTSRTVLRSTTKTFL